jgi:hypothetical protein
MSFKKNKYTVIRKVIDKDLATFVANYFSMKKQVFDTCRQARYISPYETLLVIMKELMNRYQILILHIQILQWKLYY